MMRRGICRLESAFASYREMVQADRGFSSDIDGDHGSNWRFLLVVGAGEIRLPRGLSA
jgi:hypothetical protein